MPRNTGPHRPNSTAPHRPNSACPLPGGVHKLSPHSLSMHKSVRASPSNSYASFTEPTSPPAGAQFDYYAHASDMRTNDYEALASPEPTDTGVGSPGIEVRPVIEPAQRRSSFLAEGMLEESVSCRRIGRDKDGFEFYIMRMVESHGFRWNRYLHPLADADVSRSQHLDMLDPDSDCSTTDEDEIDVSREGESAAVPLAAP